MDGEPRGIRFAYGHGFGFAQQLPYRVQRLFVHPWNWVVCRIYGHHWTLLSDNDGLTTCCHCVTQRPSTPEEIETWQRVKVLMSAAGGRAEEAIESEVRTP